MSDRVCAFENRDEAIVGYLYDDLEAGTRRAFEADLQRIQGTFTVLENKTTGEMVKQRTMLNNLATLASQRQ